MRKWKARFADAPCVETLDDRQRSGRPARIPVAVRCKLVQLACERPDEQEPPAPFRDIWTYESLAGALEEQTGHRISVSEVERILRFEDLRTRRIRQWLKSSDPEFFPKATRIYNLYRRPPKDAVVVCVDEKSD
ncbi:MAG: helix-turn-helix domain-containing protein [Ketobacter sp.]|nr:helix-turn-helix domain-containing protein [Ketobacter sp.]